MRVFWLVVNFCKNPSLGWCIESCVQPPQLRAAGKELGWMVTKRFPGSLPLEPK
jgi:hypothetical protein